VNQDDRKFALRMIPYGVFVVTAIDAGSGEAAAQTVHWVTQTSFTPCLLAVSIKANTPLLALIRSTNRFALHMLGKEDQAEAFTFCRPSRLTGSLQDGTAELGGWGVTWGRHGTVLLHNAVAVVECHMHAILEAGDHHPVIAEIIDAHVRLPQEGRPDDMMLNQRELGATIFYGG
jgi:flavin reductase (DIM6/NTAB) family NADH-FMN oxidoreductase RutF